MNTTDKKHPTIRHGLQSHLFNTMKCMHADNTHKKPPTHQNREIFIQGQLKYADAIN